MKLTNGAPDSSKLPGDERTTVPDSQSRQGKRVPFPESVESGGYTAGKSKRLSKSGKQRMVTRVHVNPGQTLEFDDLWLDALDALAVAHLVCIDYAANETFQGNFKEYKSTSSLPPTRNDHFIEKVFVARPSGKRAVWKRAGKLPFTHCVINKLFVSAPKATVVIPVHASSVMGSFVRESERTSSSMSLYEALDALRVIAGFYDEKDENLPSVVVIGLHDSSSHSTQKSREKFKRRVREALSIHWPTFETVLCTDDELGEVFECNADWLSWVRREDSEFFWAAQTIFDLYRQDLKFVPPDEIKFKQLSEQLKNLLKYGFITSTECQVRRNDPNPAIHYLINLDDIEYILLDLLEHSETAKMAFKKHGLIPFVAVKEVLDSWAKDSDYQCWLSAFQHFGIFILPANIKCEHLEPDCSYKPIGPREDYRQPASLPDPTDKAFIVPHCLPNKRLPEGDPPGYVRTAAFILRCKEGHRVSECLFYFIGAILIKHYPQSPRCYYRAMRLRVTSGHILEVKLEDDVMYASMLVQTTDNTFQSTGSAKICSLVKEALREDSKVLKGKSHLTRGLQFGAFMETHNLMKDFVDLEDSDGLTVRVFSEEGEEFYPPVSLYLWFNSYGPQGTLIEKHFAELAEQMDAEKVFRHLIKSDRISGDQYRDLVVDDNPPSSRRLLTIIAATCHDCDQLLLDALRSTHQKTLAHKIRPVFQTSTSIPSSASIPPSTSASTTLKRNLDKEEHQTVQGLAAMAKSSCYISQATDSGDDEKNETAINMSVRQKPIYRHTQARGIEEKVMPVRRSREPLFQNVVTSQTSAVSQSAKPDPQPQAIFEAKYYHVERATDYFNERPFREGGKRLGSGSFGTAYHGILHSEQGEKFEVAVKRLKKVSRCNCAVRLIRVSCIQGFSHTEAQSELYRKQFETEINILSRFVLFFIVLLTVLDL